MLSHDESVRLLSLLDEHHTAVDNNDQALWTELAEHIQRYPCLPCDSGWMDYNINPSAVNSLLETKHSRLAKFMYDTIPDMPDADKLYLIMKWGFSNEEENSKG